MATVPTTLTARRVQYRVGHGGFHATFVNPSAPSPSDRLTYVYDVGAKPDKALLLSAIGEFVTELRKHGTERVDYVFVSHIDEDHVNGLVDLLDALKNQAPRIWVANVVLPWLSPAQKLLTQARNNHRQGGTAVTNLASSDDEADKFLRDLGAEEIIRVTAEGEDATPSATHSTHAQGKPLAQPLGGWALIPTRTPTPPNFERDFKAELRRLKATSHLDPDKPQHHEELLTKHRASIRTAMKNVAMKVHVPPRDIANWSSLALLHGATPPSPACALGATTKHAEADCTHGWLHTGDLPLKSAGVWKHLQGELRKARLGSPLCVVVAPHHGSSHNHEDGLYGDTSPGTVLLTTGRKLSDTKRGTPSYSYNLPVVTASATSRGANLIELHNP